MKKGLFGCNFLLTAAGNDSGQAMFELLMLLFALMFLVVALVVISAVGGVDNAHLLRNKYAAEMAAQSDRADVVDSGEIGGWQRHSVELYRKKESIVIPFTHKDQRYGYAGSTGELEYRLQNQDDSSAEQYRYRYLELEDFQTRDGRLQTAADGDAMTAARLVGRNSSEAVGGNSDAGVAVAVRNILGGVFRQLFGKIPDPADNITNQVYMPVQQSPERGMF